MGTRDGLERLLQLVSGDEADAEFAVDEAQRLFAAARATADESRAIDLLLSVQSTRPLPEPLLVAVAAALIDRGEDAAAARALQAATSNAALLVRADLLARGGDPAAAADMTERVLARDIDWPGAREKHARWTRDAGSPRPPPVHEGAAYSGAEGLRRLDSAPFRLLRELARGGAGAVYEAQDRELGRRIALKVYHRPERDRWQLLHESRVGVALAGEGVVPVFDVDIEQGWLAMRWAPLGSLGSHLKGRDRRVTEAFPRWARSLALALARVHAAGWVHHDVKPANVLLPSPDAAWLTDFGTARRRAEASPPGTYGYVSPERLAGRASDPSDDVFGFGRVLHDAFEASRHLMIDVPESWVEVAAKCTGPDAGRPRDAAELVVILPRPS
jgi:tRNA A-37 threonylcarbamoyl transferase component Bud32